MNNVLSNIGTTVTRTVSRCGLVLRKHSPEILIGVGIVATVGAVVSAVVATKKSEPIIEEGKGNINKVKVELGPQAVENKDGSMSLVEEHEEYKHELTKAYIFCGGKVVAVFVPTALLTTTAVVAFLAAYGIVQKRNVALTSAFTLLSDQFKAYRQAVTEELGEDKDKQFLSGKAEKRITNEDGTVETKLVPVNNGPASYSQYAVFFDESNPNWRNSAEANKAFLKMQQDYLNHILQIDGHLFLNRVYERLGLPHTSAGAVVGWILGKDNENYVDFGIFDGRHEAARNFVNGYEPSILLDFNVDGLIYDKI